MPFVLVGISCNQYLNVHFCFVCFLCCVCFLCAHVFSVFYRVLYVFPCSLYFPVFSVFWCILCSLYFLLFPCVIRAYQRQNGQQHRNTSSTTKHRKHWKKQTQSTNTGKYKELQANTEERIDRKHGKLLRTQRTGGGEFFRERGKTQVTQQNTQNTVKHRKTQENTGNRENIGKTQNTRNM